MQSWHLINGSQEITPVLSPFVFPNGLGFIFTVAGGNGVKTLLLRFSAQERVKRGLVQWHTPSGLASQDRFMRTIPGEQRNSTQLHILWTS